MGRNSNTASGSINSLNFVASDLGNVPVLAELELELSNVANLTGFVSRCSTARRSAGIIRAALPTPLSASICSTAQAR
jgi:hypothetical protein